MIQRIQSLYLLAVAALMATAIFTPLAYFAAGVEEYKLYAFSLQGAQESYSTIYMGVIVALAAIIPFVNIFLFKNRLLQIRLCVSAIVLLVGSAAFIGLYCYRLCDLLASLEGDKVFTLGFASLMPVVAIIPVVLAIRGIARDEALVRSLDRIR